MTVAPASPTALRQVALARGESLDATLAFWRDTLGLAALARFDPPGIAFIMVGTVRLFFTGGPPGTVYLDEPRLLELSLDANSGLLSPPAIVHVDWDGTFGPAGEAEWMAFLKDPAGHTIGLVARRPQRAEDADAS
jgi:catechol 2,3-dioxygenase-like lactoylglutathione lyase family enzyme